MPRFVTAAEITRNFGLWQDRAAQGPLVVTHHGRPRCVMLSADAYETLAGGFPAVGDARERDAIAHALLSERIDRAFLALDGHLRITEANSLAATMLDRSREHLVGQPLSEAAPMLASGIAGAALRRVLRTSEGARLMVPAEPALDVHAFAWPGGAALLFHALGPDDDVEPRLAESAARGAAIAAHGGIGVARLTLRGTIAEAEPGFAALAGFAPERLIGVRLVDLLALSSRADVGEAIERVLIGGAAEAIDCLMLIDGGAERPIRLALAPLGEGCGVSGAMAVVTES